ncbi:DUF445 domain-containing protein [Telmatospirillum sp.]|uniref:DUF445 domain-containing protein n=1 Tax=Telmatospirillum sp. TaxID=2079197 RepID=UPI00283C8C2F|nr:DUF445 domain-containing protein [Telmatospirillum sp.]MDR3440925.1 DUF445 domain-containing protein [Telmatospirillum sp.]
MRSIATGLLLLMATVLVLARANQSIHPALAYVAAFAEAALVGGLADWFAVTALFRHPLGLPIPHTAVVPRNKDRIGDSLGNFVANNFLSPDVLLPKLKTLDVARRLADWLGREDHARLAAKRLAAAVPPLIAALQDEPVRQMLSNAALRRLHGIAAAPLMSRILTILVAGGQHLALFDIGLAAARQFVAENQESIRRSINEKSSWWVPEWIDSRLAKRILVGVEETLDEMAAADHPWRLQFQSSVESLIDRLAHAPETQARAETLKEELIAHPEVQAYLASLWTETKQMLLTDLAGGDRVERALAGALSGLAVHLVEDGRLRDLVNSWAVRIIFFMVVPNRQRLGNFMAGVVHGWDARTVVGKLELQFGRDLQYIRVNGTLVGGLVGLAIHAATTAFG